MSSDHEREPSPEPKKVKTGGDIDEKSDKIVAQLEYYFSDVNVVKDKFMMEEFKKDNGWITIETMLKFARLKALADDQETIVKALTNRESDVIEMDESKTKIKRKHELPDENTQKTIDERTLHLSGFPADYTYDNLYRWCNQYGPTDSISMRLFYKIKKFKGCIHVTFKNKDDADKVMKIDALKCKDREIRKETMELYRKRKAEIWAKKAAKRASRAR